MDHANDAFHVFDTTLRDGAQREGIAYSVADKLAVARLLDEFGVGFIEGGWPGAMPKDTEFFRRVREEQGPAPRGARRVRLDAKGECPGGQRPAGRRAARVRGARRVPRREVRRPSRDGGAADDVRGEPRDGERHGRAARRRGPTRLRRLRALLRRLHPRPRLRRDAAAGGRPSAGAEVGVLCDTNGGMLPSQIARIVDRRARAQRRAPRHPLPGRHRLRGRQHARGGRGRCDARAVHGERIRRADRQRRPVLGRRQPRAQAGDARAARGQPRARRSGSPTRSRRSPTSPPDTHQPYVGVSSFAHKAGLHASALKVDAGLYNHVDATTVGNDMRVLVTEMAGRASVELKGRELGYDLGDDREAVGRVVDRVKELESQRLDLRGGRRVLRAAAARRDRHRSRGALRRRVLAHDRRAARRRPGRSRRRPSRCVPGTATTVSSAPREGNGPVNALDNALRAALVSTYPELRARARRLQGPHPRGQAGHRCGDPRAHRHQRRSTRVDDGRRARERDRRLLAGPRGRGGVRAARGGATRIAGSLTAVRSREVQRPGRRRSLRCRRGRPGRATLVSAIDGHPFGAFEPRAGCSSRSATCGCSRPVLPSKVIGIGRNYADHAAEMGNEVPRRAGRLPQAVHLGDRARRPDPVPRAVPRGGPRGRAGGRHRPARAATCPSSGRWRRCSATPAPTTSPRATSSAATGSGRAPRASTASARSARGSTTDLDTTDLAVECRVNGEVRQAARTSGCCAASPSSSRTSPRVMTLLPGDVILTGTPAGVGPIDVGDTVTVDDRGRRDPDQPGGVRWLRPRRRPRPAARRALADGRPARRDGVHVVVQPGLRPPARRAVPAAHRGHRPRAVPRGQRAAGLRHAALARPGLGRGPRHRRPVRPVPPVRAARPLPGLRRAAARRRARVPLLVQHRAARGDARGAAEGQAAHRIRPAVRRQDAGGAGGAARVQRDARDADAHPRRRDAARSTT